MRSSIEALGQDQPFLRMETVNKSKHQRLSGYHSVFLQTCYSPLAQTLNILMEACVPSDFTEAVNTNYSQSYSDMCSVDILYSFFKVFFGGGTVLHTYVKGQLQQRTSIFAEKCQVRGCTSIIMLQQAISLTSVDWYSLILIVFSTGGFF